VIVLDASAVVDWLLLTPEGQQIDRRIFSSSESLHAPHLLDIEVAQVMRRLRRDRAISAQRAGEAMQDLLDARIARYPHTLVLPRVWQLRYNLSAYDAAYVALAETLNAQLITRDSRLASTPGHSATIELF